MCVSAVTQERKPYIQKKKKKSFCIFRGCRVTNVNFRKVSRDNIRPDFQLGRKEPCSKSLSCIESVLKQKQVQKEINQALNSSMTSSHAELKTKYSISSKWIQIWADVQKKKAQVLTYKPSVLWFFYVFVQTFSPLRQEHTQYLNRFKMQVTLQNTH